MTTLVPMNDFGIFVDKHDTARVDSRFVAQYFEKEHRHVLRDIENLDCSDEFRESNYGLSTYISEQNKKLPCYTMTRDGFVFLAMGYRGKKLETQINEMLKVYTTMRCSFEHINTSIDNHTGCL